MTGISLTSPSLATANQPSQWSQSRSLVSRFKAAWHQGDRLDAQLFLALHQAPACQRSTVLDLAYEEFCLRSEQGEVIRPDEFAAQFPDIHQSLTRLLTVHRFLMANPQLAEQGTPRTWPELGDEFLGFELIEELGRGAFARVFLASELALSRRRVVAKIGSQGAGEAEIIAKLRHPYIVPIHSVLVDRETGWSLICMPYQGRATLCDVVDSIRSGGITSGATTLQSIYETPGELGGGLPATAPAGHTPQAHNDAMLAIGRKIAEALEYAHRQGVCHQDLKPSNVLLTFSGDPVLLDFNLSSDGRPADRVGGTLPYMAPEQIEAMLTWHSVTRLGFSPSSDVFGWGVLMFELLCGQQPFRSVPVDDLRLWTGLHDSRREPVDFAPLYGQVAPALVDLLRSCLAFEPGDRPKSAQQLIDALDQNTVRPAASRFTVFSRSRLLRAAIPAVVALGLMGGYAYSTRGPLGVRQLETAKVFYGDGQFDQAIEHLNRALDADSTLAEALILRGRAHQALERYSAASTDYTSARKLTDDPRLQAATGYCLALEQNHRLAIRCFELAITAGYQSADVYNDLGYSLMRMGRTDEALDNLNRAIALDPKLQAAYANRATVELNIAFAKNSDTAGSALRDITQAIELGPPSGDLYLQAAVTRALGAKMHPEYNASVLGYLRQAVRYDCDKKQIGENPLLADFLKHPDYQAIAALKPLPNAKRQAKRLVSPL